MKKILTFILTFILAFILSVIIGALFVLAVSGKISCTRDSNKKEFINEQDNNIFFYDKRDVVFAHSSGKLLWVEPNENGKYDYKNPPVVYWQDDDGKTTEYYPAKELIHEQEVILVDCNAPDDAIAITTTDGGIEIIDSNDLAFVEWEETEAACIQIVVGEIDVTVDTKNMNKLTVEEVKDFCIFMAAMKDSMDILHKGQSNKDKFTSWQYPEEYYKGMLKLISPKLLKDPTEPNESDIFSNALHPTCPDYADPDVETADFSATTAPFMEWNWTEECFVEAEPNEPEWHQIQAMIHKDVPPGIYAIWQSPGSEIKPFDITSFIPTWPDYIELEKDLVIHRPGKTENEFIVMFFNKGTKIYFKNDK